jgi:hypothetical protein
MLIRTPTGAAPRAPGSAVAPEVLAAARAEEQRAPAANARGNRAAAVAPSSYDATARTVEVVLSAGAPVRRWSFTEELEISAYSKRPLSLFQLTRPPGSGPLSFTPATPAPLPLPKRKKI